MKIEAENTYIVVDGYIIEESGDGKRLLICPKDGKTTLQVEIINGQTLQVTTIEGSFIKLPKLK